MSRKSKNSPKVATDGPAASAGLNEQIELLGDLFQQVRVRLQSEDLSLEDLLAALDSLSRSCTRLAALLKVQRELAAAAPGDNEVRQLVLDLADHWKDARPEEGR
jgi:hypothetical protein